MSRIRYQAYRDEFAQTRWPFEDAATLLSEDNTTTLPEGAFLDAFLYPVGVTLPLHLGTITIASQLVTLTIADINNAAVATATFNPQVVGDQIPFADADGRPAGLLIADPAMLAYFSGWSPGEYAFSAEATPFAATCTLPVPGEGLRSLTIPNGTPQRNDVWLVGDRGVVLRREGESGIRIDVVGDPLFRRLLCDPLSLFVTPSFVLSINDCVPDKFGNYQMVVGANQAKHTILRIAADGLGLTISAIGSTISGG